MRGKPGISIWSLLLVPCCLFFNSLSNADILQSSNQILYTSHFHLDDIRADKVSANTLSYGFMLGIPVSLMIGLLWDLIGRRWILCSSFVLAAASTIAIPIVAPSVAGYYVAKVVFL